MNIQDILDDLRDRKSVPSCSFRIKHAMILFQWVLNIIFREYYIIETKQEVHKSKNATMISFSVSYAKLCRCILQSHAIVL